MNKNLFLSLLVFNVSALIISALWAFHDRSYESFLALAVSLTGLAGLYYNSPDKKIVKNQQHIDSVKNSGSITQAGRDIVK